MALHQIGDERARRATSALFFVEGAALGGYVAHLADIQARLHLSNAALGQALLFSALGAVTSMPAMGAVIHRLGSRRCCLIFGVLVLLVIPWVVHMPTVPWLCGALYLLGATNGQFDVAMNAHSMAVQDRFSRPILSAIHGWFSLGGFAGGAGAALAARLGAAPETHLVLSSVVLGLVLAFSLGNLLPWDVDKDSESSSVALPSRRLLFLGVLVLFAFVSEGAMWDWSAVYLRRVLHSGPVIGSLGFGLASCGMAAGRFLGDGWTERLGYRRLLIASALAAGGGLLLAVNAGILTLAISGFVVMGVGLGNLVPILFRAAARQPGVSAGVGIAAVTTCGYTGFLGGPPILGYVADLRSLSFALGMIACLCLIIAATARKAVARLDEPEDGVE